MPLVLLFIELLLWNLPFCFTAILSCLQNYIGCSPVCVAFFLAFTPFLASPAVFFLSFFVDWAAFA